MIKLTMHIVCNNCGYTEIIAEPQYKDHFLIMPDGWTEIVTPWDNEHYCKNCADAKIAVDDRDRSA